MRYGYKCPKCGTVYMMDRKVEDRDLPVHCNHLPEWNPFDLDMEIKTVTYECQRIYYPVTIMCNLSKDDPDNDVLGVLSRSSSATDKAKVARECERLYANNSDGDVTPDRIITAEDILATGIRPDMTKTEIMNWRAANIPSDPLE